MEHNWQPVVGYQGRYRCPDCGVFGYKPVVVTGPGTRNGTSDVVKPYKCCKCERDAVAKDINKKGRKMWVCQDHRLLNQ